MMATKQNWPNLCKWESLCPMDIKAFLIFCWRMWEWWATQSFSILSLREMFVRFWASSLRDNSALDWDQDSKCIQLHTYIWPGMRSLSFTQFLVFTKGRLIETRHRIRPLQEKADICSMNLDSVIYPCYKFSFFHFPFLKKCCCTEDPAQETTSNGPTVYLASEQHCIVE